MNNYYPFIPYVGYKDENVKTPQTFPPQHQNIQPGMEYEMNPLPIFDNPNYVASGKLQDKVVIISGGDSGIGRAISILFAKEGADIIIAYFNEHEDANKTKQLVESYGRRCLLLPGDLRDENFSSYIVQSTINIFGKIDVLINNCGVQFPQNSILDISSQQLRDTFETNIFSFFYLTKAVLPYLEADSSIINTTSITAFDGKKNLIDYSATKGAITVFTKSLSLSLADQKIRVNAVAPGPIWTPLIPSSFTAQEVEVFGANVPLKRAGQPFELAPAYLYLASDDSRYVTGQIIHVNGGSIV
ncbi:MAG: SDR family oxidoreductase [Clostridia bacterium]|nr:SDR family oxidoreductase [Clostridia bacterium]MCI8833325.1 SDR family oxidoreductase [Clostridia bacterium]